MDESTKVARSEMTEERGTLRIRDNIIPIVTRDVNQSKLKYYPDNPRIYTAVRKQVEHPDQEEIEKRLLEMEHVRELIRDIQQHGGLIDPLIVLDGSFEVLEGNSRLAAYRHLFTKDPIKWGKVRCTFLPANIDKQLIFALLGQYHLKGKKSWAKYEQAGFVYRRFKEHKLDLDAIAAEIGLTKQAVNRLIETYEFMIDHDENDINRWSFYDEYLKSRKIKKARETFAYFDSLIVKKVRSKDIERARDIRDRLPMICDASPKVLKKFATGSIDFEEAYEEALEAGGDDENYKRLKRFRAWLAKSEVGEALFATENKKIQYELNKLHTRIASLRKRLGDS